MLKRTLAVVHFVFRASLPALDGKTQVVEALRIAHHRGGTVDVHGRVGLEEELAWSSED